MGKSKPKTTTQTPGVVVTPNLVKVIDRITKQRVILDANLVPDYKTKYLHISGEKFKI